MLELGNCGRIWSEIVPHVRKELKRSLTCSNEFSQTNYQVSFDIIIVTDFVAKANVLIMYQYNGTFGSNICTAHGDRYEPRTPAFHQRCVSMAESLNSDVTGSKYNISGVKGKSEFE